MQYHVGRDGHQFGMFTEEEIGQGLQSGRFLTSDLVWREGMPQWKPLVEVFGFAAAVALSAPMVSVSPGGPLPANFLPNPAAYQHVGVGVMPTSGLAIGSMVVGIISLVSFFACPVGVLLGLPGVICGHMSLSQIRSSGNQIQGKGMAIAGLVMNYVAMAIGAAILLFFVLFFGIAAASAAAGGKGL
ncbi:DUF4190 domain-containing protein [Roseimicrobium sp. ORNL1]|uniref:DUF4190 domain-containing protein n=1 Tax=Roseimicrobium sp. ORNL1 TaxID=2711231 RepID=UPI0023F2265A|nr:DUF4190 domain-containing protein [Roseimicrobium sp. ORNL1]